MHLWHRFNFPNEQLHTITCTCVCVTAFSPHVYGDKKRKTLKSISTLDISRRSFQTDSSAISAAASGLKYNRHLWVHKVNEEYHDGGRVVRLLSVRGFNSLCSRVVIIISIFSDSAFIKRTPTVEQSFKLNTHNILDYWGQLLTFHCNNTTVTQI